MSDDDHRALRAYALLKSDLVHRLPALAAAIAVADDEGLDRIERLIIVHRVAVDQDPGEQDRQAEAAMEKHWPRRK